jgi:histidinol phosphatase-like PHP family hydrolase
VPLSNAAIAELLALKAENASYPLQKALRRAARSAFLWPEEAARLVAARRSLTELASVGPYLQKILKAWILNPPKIPPAPPIRRAFLTLTAAKKILAKHPYGKARLRGDLQMHTTWSDGSGTIAQMAEAGFEQGYEYIAITDHGKGLKIAGGINEHELAEQALEIQSINAQYCGKFHVLRSVELNLNQRGEGDLDIKTLRSLDIVIGAFHSSLRTAEDQTPRYLAALQHPAVNVLAHPKGRIFNYRVGLRAEWERVFQLAARLDKAVEIDCYPDRQDLSVGLLKLAKTSGTRVSLGTDSHHPWQLDFISLGLAAAAKAGIPQNRILNFLPIAKLLAWARAGRSV